MRVLPNLPTHAVSSNNINRRELVAYLEAAAVAVQGQLVTVQDDRQLRVLQGRAQVLLDLAKQLSV